MVMIGVDYHPSFQQIAFADTETGGFGERRLNHGDGEALSMSRPSQCWAVPLRLVSRWSGGVSSNDCFHCLVVLDFCAALSLSACVTSQDGPKLIEADGVRYTACAGATWLRDQSNSRDPGTMTYR